MKDNDRESVSSAKSSRRRRWDVKSRESFNSTLAFEVASPDKNDSPVSNGSKKKVENSLEQNNRPNTGTAKKKNNNDKKEVNDRNLKSPSPPTKETKTGNGQDIHSDIEEYYIENHKKISIPTAPPLSPNNESSNNELNIDNSIVQQLNELNEDIIVSKRFPNESNVPGIAVSGVLLGPGASTFNGSVSTIYCEKLNNFVISNDDKKKSGDIQDKNRNLETQTSHAVYLQTGFRTFSIMCQGILAGITISHCIMAFLLKDDSDLYENFNILEHIFFALIIFLTTICVVASFDRCDLAGQGIFSGKGLQVPWTPLFYIVSFTLSLVMVRAESFFAYFDIYSKEIQNKKSEMLLWWQYMALSRTVFAVLAWAAQASEPHFDALHDRISELSQPPI